jgi:hypothetical protein
MATDFLAKWIIFGDEYRAGDFIFFYEEKQPSLPIQTISFM